MILGAVEPRIYTPPLRELTPETSLGFDVIDFVKNVLHEEMLPWQEWLFIHALEIIGDLDSGDWHFRYRTVITLISRQNGKTYCSRWLILWFQYVFGVRLVVGMAQNLAMAEETWSSVLEMIEDDDDLKAEITKVIRTNGSKSIQLTDRREYKIAPCTRKGARGLAADLCVLDELREHQNFNAWSSISKTMLSRDNAICWCMSNAGDATSVVLRRLRLLAHKQIGDPDGICAQLDMLGDATDDDGKEVEFDETIGLFEWSAHPECSIWDEEEWALANPSLNREANGQKLLNSRALKSAASQDPENEFRTECLTQWIDTSRTSPFPTDSWENGKDPNSRRAPDAQLFYGADISSNHNHISLAICGKRARTDEEPVSYHVEAIKRFTKQGMFLNYLRERVVKDGGSLQLAIQGKGANISFLADTLEDIQGLELTKVEGPDLPAYHGRFYEGIAASETGSESDAPRIYHRPAALLDLSASIAATRPMGDGAWAFDRTRSDVDISPLIACVMAHGLATSTPAKPKKISAYADGHDLIFL